MSKTSLINLQNLTGERIGRLFSIADDLADTKAAPSSKSFNKGLTAALIFLEPSTRTRMSFEIACLREGVGPVVFDSATGTSLEKGETFEDTMLNIAAMKPSLIVVRSNDTLDMAAVDAQVEAPIINAGWGRQGHPTQALLDAYTLKSRTGRLQGERLLIIGDVRHSRVASSHLELAPLLGYEIGFCGPRAFMPEAPTVKVFDRLQDGLDWATGVMSLRVQLERHDSQIDLADYHALWGINKNNLKSIRPDAYLMHPGPINWGVEMSADVMKDSRNVILKQVESGARIRQALVRVTLDPKGNS